MDRLFGKELSNLLNPISLNNAPNATKIPSRSTRDIVLGHKEAHKRHEVRSSSVVHDKK